MNGQLRRSSRVGSDTPPIPRTMSCATNAAFGSRATGLAAQQLCEDARSISPSRASSASRLGAGTPLYPARAGCGAGGAQECVQRQDAAPAAAALARMCSTPARLRHAEPAEARAAHTPRSARGVQVRRRHRFAVAQNQWAAMADDDPGHYPGEDVHGPIPQGLSRRDAPCERTGCSPMCHSGKEGDAPLLAPSWHLRRCREDPRRQPRSRPVVTPTSDFGWTALEESEATPVTRIPRKFWKAKPRGSDMKVFQALPAARETPCTPSEHAELPGRGPSLAAIRAAAGRCGRPGRVAT